MMRHHLIILVLLLPIFNLQSQSTVQTIRGTVVDQDSKIPLIGASVLIIGEGSSIGAATDIEGRFKLADVPVGRVSLQITYLGYAPRVMSNLVLGSGKELVLNIELQEDVISLAEVVVTAERDKAETLNDMGTVSGRSFSVEETQRYAASFLDPARMAQNFAGVSSSGDDLSNEIIIRGNSPAYVQWRLEGIQIPGPNHYASQGSSGGGISMLSSSMLGDSDFYTGAFPADIGNALAGAFDLNFRNGNNQKREHSFQVGVLGIEASSEGPFSENSSASYLVNYRYSALGLIQQVTDLDFGDADINFQDLSFKINVPTKKAGVFSLFGLGGLSQSSSELVTDSTQWMSNRDLFQFRESNSYGLVGLKHRFLFSNQKTYLTTIISGTYNRYELKEEFIDRNRDFMLIDDETEDLNDKVLRTSITLNHKASARHNYRAGIVWSNLGYRFLNSNRLVSSLGNFSFDYTPRVLAIDDEGRTDMLQGFAMHRYRPSNSITINSGIHFTYFRLSASSAIEPRLGIRWQASSKHSFALSGGLHSQAEHLINYTLRRETADGQEFQPNLELGLTKSAHFVAGYDWSVKDNLRIKIETYLQRLYDVPIDVSFPAGSILNAEDVYDVLYSSNALVNEGNGKNIGIDVTVEKFLSNGFYYLVTGSLFDSSFTGTDGNKYNTRYNSRYNLTLVGGKEFSIGRERKNLFGINTRVLYYGGNRYSEYDFSRGTLTEDGFFKLQASPYFRTDLSFNYRLNTNSASHIIALELQNLTNRKNIADIQPDFNTGSYATFNQSGLIPNLYYRIEF